MKLITTFHCDGCSKVASTERSDYWYSAALPPKWGLVTAEVDVHNKPSTKVADSKVGCAECLPAMLQELGKNIDAQKARYRFTVQTDIT